jgi:hypothetical protein
MKEKRKLSRCVIQLPIKKGYGEVEVVLEAFLNLTLDGGEGPDHAPADIF